MFGEVTSDGWKTRWRWEKKRTSQPASCGKIWKWIICVCVCCLSIIYYIWPSPRHCSPWKRANRITLPRMSIFHTFPSGFLYFLLFFQSFLFFRASSCSVRCLHLPCRLRTGLDSIRCHSMSACKYARFSVSTVCAYFALLFRSFFRSYKHTFPFTQSE